MQIKNHLNESLDVLIEGDIPKRDTVIMVHGFATDKHETAGYFDDLSSALTKKYRVVRFDFSGCGKSEGKTEEKSYEVWAKDLLSIIQYVKTHFGGKIHIIAQSAGSFITTLANPSGITKTVFTSLPNTNTQYIKEKMLKRFGTREGAIVNLEGITVFPRSSGKSTKIGPSFWKVLEQFNPVQSVAKYAEQTRLLVVHPKQDEIIRLKYLDGYKTIPNITIKWVNGDHSFTKNKDRNYLIKEIMTYFENE